MNLGRLLFRIWIAVSLCWIVAWSWYYHVFSCGPVHDGEVADLGWHCDGPPAADGQYLVVPLPVMVAVIVGIPIAVLFAGVSLHWIALASRRDRTN
jgi:hypothetical protein